MNDKQKTFNRMAEELYAYLDLNSDELEGALLVVMPDNDENCRTARSLVAFNTCIHRMQVLGQALQNGLSKAPIGYSLSVAQGMLEVQAGTGKVKEEEKENNAPSSNSVH